jgi:lipopolysaccharide assembly outer membrane protein LptD (OstA)
MKSLLWAVCLIVIGGLLGFVIARQTYGSARGSLIVTNMMSGQLDGSPNLRGDVRVRVGADEIRADEVYVDRDTRELVLRGNVRMVTNVIRAVAVP